MLIYVTRIIHGFTHTASSNSSELHFRMKSFMFPKIAFFSLKKNNRNESGLDFLIATHATKKV